MMSSTTRSICAALDQLARGGRTFRDARPQPVFHEIAGKQVADVAVIVDDKDVRRCSIAPANPMRRMPLKEKCIET
jgi:hypothetical protein